MHFRIVHSHWEVANDVAYTKWEKTSVGILIEVLTSSSLYNRLTVIMVNAFENPNTMGVNES